MGVLPDFLIIGVQKGGTTSLYHYLGQHPRVRAVEPKEIHYFDRHYAQGGSWYRSHFGESRLPRPLRRWITGEATPYYIFHPHAPDRIARDLPHAKLIVLLRDPVERAFSQYKMEAGRGIEPLSFREALEAEEHRLAGERERMLADPEYHSVPYQSFSYKARGRYVEQLRLWYSLFPRRQILVLSAEDLYREPEGVYRNALQFLGLPEYQLTNYEVMNRGRSEQLPPDIREELASYFAPYNRELFALIDREVAWH